MQVKIDTVQIKSLNANKNITQIENYNRHPVIP